VLSLSVLKMLRRWGPVRHLMLGQGVVSRRQNSVISLREPLGVRRRLGPVTHQRSPCSRSDRPEPLRSSRRAPPRWPRPAEAATAGPTVFAEFMGSPLLPARGTVARRNGFMRCRGGRVFGRPSGPQDRTQPAKLEIPFSHAVDNRGVSLPKSAVRVYPVGRETHRVTAAALEAHSNSDAWTHWSVASMFGVRIDGLLLTLRSTSRYFNVER
jgi:hypothetical protein